MSSPVTTPIRGKFNYLTKTESKVAAYLVYGFSIREIGEKLFVTDKTIKFHTTNIYKKLSVKSKVKLIVAWHRQNLDPMLIQGMKIHADKIHDEIALKKEKCFLPIGNL